jgi:protein phosphatase
MFFNIEAFTHKGVLRDINQDTMLVHNRVLDTGTVSLEIKSPTRCFVADGVGGHPAGEVASRLVLEYLNDELPLDSFPDKEAINGLCHEINLQLINYSAENPVYAGMATTLAGIIFYENRFYVINAGDSRVLLLRDHQLQKLTQDQVLAPELTNSPITSYFGGTKNALDIIISSGNKEVRPEDIFLVSSDGIFKALTLSQIEKILSNSKSLKEKAEFIFYKAIQNGAPDNISCIFIGVQNDI